MVVPFGLVEGLFTSKGALPPRQLSDGGAALLSRAACGLLTSSGLCSFPIVHWNLRVQDFSECGVFRPRGRPLYLGNCPLGPYQGQYVRRCYASITCCMWSPYFQRSLPSAKSSIGTCPRGNSTNTVLSASRKAHLLLKPPSRAIPGPST